MPECRGACGRPVKYPRVGLCNTCFGRWHRAGRPEQVPAPQKTPTPQAFAAAKAARQAKSPRRLAEYVALAGQGLSNLQAAQALGVTARTIQRYRRSLGMPTYRRATSGMQRDQAGILAPR